MRRLTFVALASVSFAALAAASPATAQTPQPANPEADPCQAPSGQVDKAQCPDADTPAGEAVQQGAQVTSSADEEGIVVVGSRIRRNRFNTADPVTIITRDEQVDSGFNSTAEVLQSVGVTGGTPQINDTYGGLVTEGGPGANTLSLRGLGATRTLVLLNGRRLSPAGTRGQVGATDLNVLPNAIIDRIEVLNTGASSIYGSDAVAGVVNVVTRNKINGLTFEMQQDAPEVGAGWSSRYSLVAGATGSRWSLAGSLEWYDRKRLTQRSAKWARCPQQLRMNGIGTPRGSGDFIDPATGESKCWPLEEGGVTVNTIATGFVFTDDPADLAPGFETAPPGYNLYCNRWRPDPTNTGSLPGFQCVGGLLYNPTTGGAFGTNLNVRDTFAPSMLNQDIISPGRNYTGFLTGTYDTGAFGDGQLYAELLVTRRKSQQNGQRQFYIDYPRNSPLIPVGLRSHPLSGSTGIRAFTDYGIYDSSQTQDYIKASAGFRGDLPFLSKWRYDLYGSKSWSDGTYSFEQILADRLAQSLRVVAAPGGGFNCTVTTGGCVAAPALTPDVIAGNYHDLAWFDYITDDVVGHTKFREVTANLTLDGPLFTLPGGDASLATGIEYRKSKIADIPSSDSIRGNLYGFSSAPETIGTDWVWEAYGEVELPILAHVPFAEALTINGSARYTDYHSYGSGTTYKIGGLYSPTRWLSLRGSYGTSYRAPALFEQFLGSTTGFLANTTDPCNNLFDVTIPAVRARCLADGLPANFIQNNGVTVIQRGGAEAGLQAETSKNLTFGGVFQPTMGPAFGNLSLAVDYFDIEVDNGVSQLGAGTVANGCYQGTHPEYCQFVSRAPYTGPGTGAFTITQTYINVATDRIKGIDFVMRYDHELGRGKFSLGAEAVRTLKRINQTDPDSDPFNYIGFIGYPKWAGTGHAAFEIGSWYFRWGVEFIQGTDDTPYAVNNLGFDPDVYNFKLPDYWLHTLAVRYEDGPFSITGGVRNVFDKKPPKITAQDPFVNTIANVPLQAGYDMSGRTYFVNVRAKIF